MKQQLPDMSLQAWRPTRDSLHQLARILGKLRGHAMPRSKHWWHITLQVTARGLTTTPFPCSGNYLELSLDLVAHSLVIESSDGWRVTRPLIGQTEAGLCRWITDSLSVADAGLDAELLAAFDNQQALSYDSAAIDRFRRTINWVNGAFRAFKGGLRQETGPVQIFPHHMDLSMNWFSGRRVPGVDPADEEAADEQLNFGFVTGDNSIPDAYFYVTAYPAPAGWINLELPQGAYWHTQGWTGAILPYAAVVASDMSLELLLGYLQTLQAHGADLMAQ